MDIDTVHHKNRTRPWPLLIRRLHKHHLSFFKKKFSLISYSQWEKFRFINYGYIRSDQFVLQNVRIFRYRLQISCHFFEVVLAFFERVFQVDFQRVHIVQLNDFVGQYVCQSRHRSSGAYSQSIQYETCSTSNHAEIVTTANVFVYFLANECNLGNLFIANSYKRKRNK